ncbi:ribosome silencing factor [Gemmatimonadota bacterium]
MTGSRSSLRAQSGIPAETLARVLAEAALEKKADDILIMDMRTVTTVTDFFVVMTVSADTHSRAVEQAVSERARNDFDSRPWHIEGGDGSRTWVLMDYVDVVVHIFQSDAREFYSLERLWGDSPVRQVTDEVPIAEEDPVIHEDPAP